MSEWKEFQKTITWGDVFREYLDALHHVERYKESHPEEELPVPVYAALQHMVELYQRIRPIIENPAMHNKPATREASTLILKTVARVRRDVPTCGHLGYA